MMKHTIMRHSKFYLSLLAFALMGCNDIVDYDKDYVPASELPNTAPPVILGVYDVTDVIYDKALTAVSPGQRVRIHGTNLNHVQRLSFNGFEVDPAQLGVATDYCVATVPEAFDIDQREGVSYTTDLGTATTALRVTPRPLEMRGLVNAYAAGPVVAVGGRYFKAYHFGEDDRTAVLLNGTTPLSVATVTDSELWITIPDGTPDNSVVTWQWTDDEGVKHDFSSHYRPSAYRCFDEFPLTTGDSFNDQEGYDLSAWVEADGVDGIPPLGSPILRLAGHAKQWGWYSANIDAMLKTPYAIAGMNDYDPTLTRGYLFAFEVMTLSPMPSSADGDKNGLMFSMEWGETCEWSPSDTEEAFDTHGEWVTVSLPLSAVATKGLRPISWGGTTHLGIILSPIVAGAEYNLRISNFRIVQDLNFDESAEPDPEPEPEPEPEPGPKPNPGTNVTLFEGSQVLGSAGNDALTIATELCEVIQLGDVLAVTIEDIVEGWCQLNVAGCNPWTTHPDTNWSTFTQAGTLQFTLSDEPLVNSMRTGGIMIQGKNCTLTRVEIIRAEN